MNSALSVFRPLLMLYTDADGCICPRKTSVGERMVSGNPVRYSAESVHSEVRLDEMSTERNEEWRSLFGRCFRESGLLRRGPLRPEDTSGKYFDQEGPDDYYALIGLSRFMGWGFHKDILAYGRASKCKLKGFFSSEKTGFGLFLGKILDILLGWITVDFNFNNVNPGTMHRSSWMGRQRQFVAALQFANGEKPSFIDKLVWCYCMVYGPKVGNNDSVAITWHLLQAGHDNSRLCRWAAGKFQSFVETNYYLGMREVIKYEDTSHPNTLFFPRF